MLVLEYTTGVRTLLYKKDQTIPRSGNPWKLQSRDMQLWMMLAPVPGDHGFADGLMVESPC